MRSANAAIATLHLEFDIRAQHVVDHERVTFTVTNQGHAVWIRGLKCFVPERRDGTIDWSIQTLRPAYGKGRAHRGESTYFSWEPAPPDALEVFEQRHPGCWVIYGLTGDEDSGEVYHSAKIKWSRR